MKNISIILLAILVVGCCKKTSKHSQTSIDIMKSTIIKTCERHSAYSDLSLNETAAVCSCNNNPRSHSHFEIDDKYVLNLSTNSGAGKSYLIPSDEMKKNGWPNEKILLSIKNLRGRETTSFYDCNYNLPTNRFYWKSDFINQPIMIEPIASCTAGHYIVIHRTLKQHRISGLQNNDLVYINVLCAGGAHGNHGGVVHAEHGGSTN